MLIIGIGQRNNDFPEAHNLMQSEYFYGTFIFGFIYMKCF